MPITFTRGSTSRSILDIDWDYPVTAASRADQTQTSASSENRVLRTHAAIAQIAGDDTRPLLIVRECRACMGTDAALFHQKQANDRTLLLTRFFHCVKLPPGVVQPDHPYSQLFAEFPTSHVLFASADGTSRSGLPHVHSVGSLWRAMGKVLARDYEGKPDRAVQQMLKLLDQFDRVDAQELSLFERMEKEIEAKGPRSPRLAKLRAQREGIETEKRALRERFDELAALPLKSDEAPEPAAPARER